MGNELNIIVCIKQVPDPDGPSTAFSVDSDGQKVSTTGIPPVLSPYDENALEAALRIKDEHGGKITVLSMGQKLTKNVGIKSLAVGADEMVLFQDGSIDDMDCFSNAYGIAEAIKKIDTFDLILCGRQASDTNGGIVGVGIAENLGIPSVSMAHKIEVADGKAIIERMLPDGFEVLEVEMPALVTISSDIYELRYTTVKGMMAAKKKNIENWKIDDVDSSIANQKRMNLISLSERVSTRQCEIIGGATLEEAGKNLAKKIIEYEIV